MKVSKKEDFAILLMTVLARNFSDKYIPLSFVSKETNLSPLFLKHIALELKNKGLIISREGINGGYRLSRNPGNITAAHILAAVNKVIVKTACDSKTCRIEKDSCICLSFWNGFNRQMLATLQNVKLSDIARL
ncbi:hypothetical protein A2W14_00745 [Candidatus Gottesmanbacteria bacterium RBG_16_37_8]|uniref:Rrf2 family transcriptional regulator n=1 Tax=Candidatus Gottesmanbacteria bacterium RBG_16_37_8 TaxID=1798371 RepID=A0A1F5YV15_9BACT|nr:MAG: hypothetical protein A2W14_00745 [Candidatus Gottesmanbacteria bacterium RBG_16_37_8]